MMFSDRPYAVLQQPVSRYTRSKGLRHIRVTLNNITDNSNSNTIKSRNFMRLVTFPTKVLNLSNLLPPLGYHRPRPSFSLSEKSPRPPRLNLGKLLDIFRACLLKNPVFRVEKEGYPLTSSLLAFALAQVTLPLPLAALPFMYKSGYVFLGDDRPPIELKSLVRPGLDHPPPARGEGDRDSDIVSVRGVPGMVESKPEPRPWRPDVAP